MTNLGTFLKKRLGAISVVIIVVLLLICGVINTNANAKQASTSVSATRVSSYKHLANKLANQAIKADEDTTSAVNKTLTQLKAVNDHKTKSVIDKDKNAATEAQTVASKTINEITSQDKGFDQIHKALNSVTEVTVHRDQQHLSDAQSAIDKVQDQAVRHYLNKSYMNKLKKIVSQAE
ncbi:hypothetical protein [Furfurilactobacillus rossiae]|uniref:Uncharacterized protein n=1 Tax=Furfurilactobacillus rossiae DSM 15814 TaxID=1114972 RepID=A0A0R1RJQ3_9LACO|nr:hypothetical protein [Furfurilactobacillus rossiae]KRL57197.1 hypothetical protein FD35_GL000205 [Furfurilactobacillus rossiae DSM 15814]QFR65917.1 hypothetical protein LR814_01835 [Furfurilactobacillus rossiae]QLE61333.1 hypothetical protein LROSRS0_1287 [Furfurilactobacillus rossiae]